MEFNIDTANVLKIKDMELSELLQQVYVGGGFVDADQAISLFDPSAVRQRGVLIGAREIQTSILAGVVIVVSPESPACRLAKNNEVEMHLLGVKPAYRQNGLGSSLIEATISNAKQGGYKKMILWTQTTMLSAQRLYESMHFIHTKEMSRNGIDFLVYERELST